MRKTKSSTEQAAKNIADIVEKHLSKLPVAERAKRIDSFEKRVSALADARAKSSPTPLLQETRVTR